MQCAQGRPYAKASAHEADLQADTAQAEPYAYDEARQPKIRQLEDISRRGLLVSRSEVKPTGSGPCVTAMLPNQRDSRAATQHMDANCRQC